MEAHQQRVVDMSPDQLRALIAEHDNQLARLQDATHELMDLRAETAGKPIVDQKAYKEQQAYLEQLRPFALMYTLRGEARAAAALQTFLMLGIGTTGEMLERLPPVQRIQREYPIDARWRVDFGIEHADRSLTLIEVKDSEPQRLVSAGIGQVLFYKSVIERSTSFSRIHPVLAVLHERDDDIGRACELAGVEYLPMGDISWMRPLSRLMAVATGMGN